MIYGLFAFVGLLVFALYLRKRQKYENQNGIAQSKSVSVGNIIALLFVGIAIIVLILFFWVSATLGDALRSVWN